MKFGRDQKVEFKKFFFEQNEMNELDEAKSQFMLRKGSKLRKY
jgi:hypothetical protein